MAIQKEAKGALFLKRDVDGVIGWWRSFDIEVREVEKEEEEESEEWEENMN